MFDTGLIEKLVSSENYYKKREEVEKLRHKAIKMSHKYHFENNRFYHDYCKLKGLNGDIKPKDFHKIVIPDGVFKSYEMECPEKNPQEFKKWVERISSVPIDFTPKGMGSLESFLEEFYSNGLMLGFSSGTSGKLTFLPRDEFTRSMIVKSYTEAIDATLKLNKGQEKFILGIPKKTFLQVGYNGRVVAENISPGNVFHAIDSLKADIIRLRMRGPRSSKEKIMNYFIKKMLPRIEKNSIKGIVSNLEANRGKRVVFMGPPFLIINTAKYVLEHGIDAKIGEDSFFASTGGFKGRSIVSRDKMNDLIQEAFGLDPKRYIDLYGMTESNSIMVDCLEGNNKHIPPWMEVILFDEHMEPIPPEGKVTGNYAFLEPSSKSFPGFITTGDKIKVDYDGCPACDKKTPILLSIERLPRLESRGCSGVLAKTVAD
jgi:hypothetical protein